MLLVKLLGAWSLLVSCLVSALFVVRKTFSLTRLSLLFTWFTPWSQWRLHCGTRAVCIFFFFLRVMEVGVYNWFSSRKSSAIKALCSAARGQGGFCIPAVRDRDWHIGVSSQPTPPPSHRQPPKPITSYPSHQWLYILLSPPRALCSSPFCRIDVLVSPATHESLLVSGWSPIPRLITPSPFSPHPPSSSPLPYTVSQTTFHPHCLTLPPVMRCCGVGGGWENYPGWLIYRLHNSTALGSGSSPWPTWSLKVVCLVRMSGAAVCQPRQRILFQAPRSPSLSHE